MRKLGWRFSPNVNDVRYLLWASRRRLEGKLSDNEMMSIRGRVNKAIDDWQGERIGYLDSMGANTLGERAYRGARLAAVGGRMRQLNAPLMDSLHVEHSAYESGWAGVGEPRESYGVDARDVAQSMDDNNGTEVVRFIDFLRRGRLEQDESRYFHVGETGDILNEHGISGKITIGTSAVNSHHNEDADHLDENDWVEVIEKINEPVAITEYGDRGNSYRIYTIVEKNGKNICVGVDVNSVGRDVNITNIRTAFARDIANALNERLVYPHSRTELETAIRELSLRHDREVYPEQPFDPSNIRNNSETNKLSTTNLRFSSSDDLDSRFGERWRTEQTNDDGRHTTQVKNTIHSYEKFGEWVKADSGGRPVRILDASSGLGLGTEHLRKKGFDVDDVEPYPSRDRLQPTFTSYDDVRDEYDYIISNAVLNVIPDDWRAGLLHDMADKLKPGGKMVINVRGAESIRKQGKEGMTRTTLDDPSEILVHRPDGSIKSYQKGFTKSELIDWCEQELGDGYHVEIANKKTAGSTYDTAVVVTKDENFSASESSGIRFSEESPNKRITLNNVGLIEYERSGRIWAPFTRDERHRILQLSTQEPSMFGHVFDAEGRHEFSETKAKEDFDLLQRYWDERIAVLESLKSGASNAVKRRMDYRIADGRYLMSLYERMAQGDFTSRRESSVLLT